MRHNTRAGIAASAERASRPRSDVIVSAVISRTRTPGKLLRAWSQGAFELVVSRLLLAELARTLSYPKLRRLVPPDEARDLIDWLEGFATIAEDPADPPVTRSTDPGDDYLIALAAETHAVLVSGDVHLLRLAADLPIMSPSDFHRLLEEDH